MSAPEYERLYRGNKALGIEAMHPGEDKDLAFVSAKDGTPLTFRGSYDRAGRTGFIAAHWARQKGFGDQDHIFPRNDNSRVSTIKQALEEERVLLLSLNMELASRPVSFQDMEEKGAKRLKDWVGEHRGQYLSIPVKSVNDALKALKTARRYGAVLRDQVFAHHEGAVVPYRNFYLGDKRDHMLSLQRTMKEGKGGVPIGNTRMIGFPRLMCFVPTDTTIDPPDERAHTALHGNHLKRYQGKPFYTHLVFTHKDDALAIDPYKILEGDITAGHAHYVLASPSVTVGEDPKQFAAMRWNINAIDLQTQKLGQEGEEQLARAIKKKNYSSNLYVQRVEERAQNNGGREQNQENPEEPPPSIDPE